MPRIRTIKPEFWGDEKLAPCSPLTRLVFLGLISMADDAGRLVDNVKVIDAFIFPESSETSRGSLGELSGMSRIKRGITASGQRVIQIVNWKAHQKIEKMNLKAALPELVSEVVAEQEVTDPPRLIGEASGTSRGGVGEESSNHTYDLRPTTSIPTTYDHLPKRAKKPRASAPVENWVSELGDWWVAEIGAVEYGQLGRKLKPLRSRYTDEQIKRAAKVYFSPDEGPRFRTVADFATNFGQWLATADEPLVRNGVPTPRADRLARGA